STKTGTCEVALILELRSQRNLGARRIQSELKRLTGNSNNPQSPLPESG
ncbi:putative transposase 7 domain protein, partial [Escherichia coli DEC2E]